jgi:hypothetical protein
MFEMISHRSFLILLAVLLSSPVCAQQSPGSTPTESFGVDGYSYATAEDMAGFLEVLGDCFKEYHAMRKMDGYFGEVLRRETDQVSSHRNSVRSVDAYRLIRFLTNKEDDYLPLPTNKMAILTITVKRGKKSQCTSEIKQPR